MKLLQARFWLILATLLFLSVVIAIMLLACAASRAHKDVPLSENDLSIVDGQDRLFNKGALAFTKMDQSTSSFFKKEGGTALTVSSSWDIPFGILMYHHIDDNPEFTRRKLSVTPENFERQVSFLLDRGYHFVTLDQAFEYVIREGHAPLKTLVLTFDDGYRSFYTAAFPILKKYQIPASVYVINQDIGKRGNLTNDMLKDLTRSGLVEIGAHTVNHKILSHLSESEQFFQLAKSKQKLEELLKIPITTVAYPFGKYNVSTTRLSENIGFKGGVSVYFGKKPAASHRYDWRRVQIQNKDQGEGLLRLLYAAFIVVK